MWTRGTLHRLDAALDLRADRALGCHVVDHLARHQLRADRVDQVLGAGEQRRSRRRLPPCNRWWRACRSWPGRAARRRPSRRRRARRPASSDRPRRSCSKPAESARRSTPTWLKPFSSASLICWPVTSSFTVLLPNGSSARMSPRVSFDPAAYSLSARMPPPLVIADLGVDRLARGVGDQVADRRLLAADRRAAAVERRLGRADLDRQLLVELVLVGLARPPRSSASGSTPIVSTMSNSGVQLISVLPSSSVLSSVMVVTTT